MSNCLSALLVRVQSLNHRWRCNTFLVYCFVTVHGCILDLHVLLGTNYIKLQLIIFAVILSVFCTIRQFVECVRIIAYACNIIKLRCFNWNCNYFSTIQRICAVPLYSLVFSVIVSFIFHLILLFSCLKMHVTSQLCAWWYFKKENA